jgi:glycosyltransferase involved in cell wall biosynthesis
MVCFSVVIPTHNRVDLLLDAVHSVTSQTYSDWELVIFDNCSDRPIEHHIRSFNDHRICFARSSSFLPVTESWNAAIDLAKGEYVTFLGDDDGLTPGYFERVAALIEQYRSPDLIYGSLYQFFHPGVAPWERAGYVSHLKNGFFFGNHTTPFLLPRSDARAAVVGSMNLRRNFTFNMQAFCTQKQFLETLRSERKVFHSPFPDYYFANLAFAKAERIVIDPRPISIAGVSKASFGYTLFNNLEENGAKLLNTKLSSDDMYIKHKAKLLNGPEYHTNYILTMAHLSHSLGDLSPDQPNFKRYRRLQIYHCLTNAHGRGWREKLRELGLYERLNLSEQLWAFGVDHLFKLNFGPKRWRQRMKKKLKAGIEPYAFIPENHVINVGNFGRLRDLFDALNTSTGLQAYSPSLTSCANQPSKAKVSFLIPSKNRLELLKRVLGSILFFENENFEIIVSDNASSDDYSSYISSLNSDRVVYSRSEKPLAVTENWQRALSMARGDYILTLGDDDAVTPAFFDNVRPYLTEAGPEVVFLGAYHYCYPGVIPSSPRGYLARVRNSEFLAGKNTPFSLASSYARELANSILDMRYRFGFNAQYFLLKASFVNRLSMGGSFYRSPYPDTYAALLSFWHAASIVVVPNESVIIGISPKSFGFYYYNDKVDDGYNFLNNEGLAPEVWNTLEGFMLPGDRNNTNWLVSAEVAKRAIADPSMQPLNIARYRTLQMLAMLRFKYIEGQDVAEGFRLLRSRLSESEILLFDLLDAAFSSAAKQGRDAVTGLGGAFTRQLDQFWPAEITFLNIGAHRSVDDALLWLGERRLASAA